VTLKFEINEIWENRLGELFQITGIMDRGNYPIAATHLRKNYMLRFTYDGAEVPHLKSDLDLVTYKGVSSDFPEFFL